MEEIVINIFCFYSIFLDNSPPHRRNTLLDLSSYVKVLLKTYI